MTGAGCVDSLDRETRRGARQRGERLRNWSMSRTGGFLATHDGPIRNDNVLFGVRTDFDQAHGASDPVPAMENETCSRPTRRPGGDEGERQG